MSVPVGVFVGLATVDLIHRVNQRPGPNEKVEANRADIAAGGPATGAAVTFAGLQGDAVLLTALGQGPLAGLVCDDLGRHHVAVHDVAPTSAGPAISAVTVVEETGERSVISRNAAGRDVAAPDDVDVLVATADVVLVDGHHPRLALAAARGARDAGVPVVLDAGSWKPVLKELLELTTMAVCSADFSFPDGSPASASMIDAGPALVAATDGGGAVRWWSGVESGRVSVPAVDAVDSLGAGDVFHGAYAYAIARGVDPVVALQHAAAVASLRVTHVGPRAWLSDPRLGTLRDAVVA